MKKYILFDIDGTLIENKKYPINIKNIKEEILLLRDKGIIFGICTYRPFDSKVKKIMDDYFICGPVISEGGACFYENKEGKYILKKTIPNNMTDFNCYINNILKIQNLEMNKDVLLNENRLITKTIKFSKEHEGKINNILELLKKEKMLKKQKVKIDNKDKLKITIEPKNNNKIKAIKKFLKDKSVILISDYEENIEEHDSCIKVYSVGTNEKFNSYSDEVFEEFGEGVEKILLKLRRKL